MTNNSEKFCTKLYKMKNQALDNYNIKMKNTLKSTFRNEIIKNLEKLAENGFYDCSIVLYICSKEKSCFNITSDNDTKSSQITYCISNLSKLWVFDKNVFEDAYNIFKSLLENEGFKIDKCEIRNAKQVKKRCMICNCWPENEAEIHIYWNAEAAENSTPANPKNNNIPSK